MLKYCRNVAAMIPHENFGPGGERENDILVVKTDKPFQMTPYVNIIKLAATENDVKGKLNLNCIAIQVGQAYNVVPFILQHHQNCYVLCILTLKLFFCYFCIILHI